MRAAIARAQVALDAHNAPACGRYAPTQGGIGSRCDLPAHHEGECRSMDEADGWEVLADLLRDLSGAKK